MTTNVAPVLSQEPSSSLQTSPVRPPRKRKAAAVPAAPAAPVPDLPADPSVDSQLTEGNETSSDDEIMGLDSNNEPPSSSLSIPKRRRLEIEQHNTALDAMQREHLFFGDELLDHLLLLRNADEDTPLGPRPRPPSTFHPDTPVDEAGHTVLHWAAALADLDLLTDFLDRGANIGALSHLGETPLVFASQYTNSHQRRTLPRLISYLGTTIGQPDTRGCTALHHAAKLTSQPNLAPAGRYYFENLLGYMSTRLTDDDMSHVLDIQNAYGDTALTIVARVGDPASIRILLRYGANTQIVNDAGKSAEEYLQARDDRARWKELRAPAVLPTSELSGAGEQNDDPHHNDDNDDEDHEGVDENDPLGMTRGMRLRARTATELLERERARLQDEKNEVLAACTRAEAERAKVKKAIDLDYLRLQQPTDPDVPFEEWRDAAQTTTTAAHDDDTDEEQLALENAEQALYELLLEEDQEYTPPPLAVSSNSNDDRTSMNHSVLGEVEDENDENEVEDDLVKEIQALDDHRQDLLRQVAKQTALVPDSKGKDKGKAGKRNKTGLYKQLIARCLNVREEDVQLLAGSILEHLEAEREGGGGERGGGEVGGGVMRG